MARVTVEDCIDKVTNRFELVMVAAQRARKIGSGAQLTISRDNDKNPVVALREIAGENVAVPELKEELIRNNQRIIAMDEDEDEEIIDLMDGEKEWNSIAGQADSEDDSDASDSDDDLEGEPSLEDIAGVARDE